jgi:hypothetical protein
MITADLKKYNNRVHYLKWILNREFSIRYYFRYEKNIYKKYEFKYVLKSHYTKEYIVLSRKEANEYINKYCKKQIEIFGFQYQKRFKKVIISEFDIELVNDKTNL